jgi:hypothetical protein
MRWLLNHQVSRPHLALAENLRPNLPERIWAEGDHRNRVHHVRAKTGPIPFQDGCLLHWEETTLHLHPPGPADRYGKRHASWPAHLGKKGSNRAPRAESARGGMMRCGRRQTGSTAPREVHVGQPALYRLIPTAPRPSRSARSRSRTTSLLRPGTCLSRS